MYKVVFIPFGEYCWGKDGKPEACLSTEEEAESLIAWIRIRCTTQVSRLIYDIVKID